MSKRLKAYRRGLWAEALCRLALRLKGYRIVASRYKVGQGEIDIVAFRRGMLAFIEVKARQHYEEAAACISPRQQARIRTAAMAFMGRNPRFARCSARFDAMLVMPWRWPVHIERAWE